MNVFHFIVVRTYHITYVGIFNLQKMAKIPFVRIFSICKTNLNQMPDKCIDISRAIADLEILAAAYPDEVVIPYDLSKLHSGEDKLSNNDINQNENEQNVTSPLTFTLILPDPLTFISISSEEKARLRNSSKDTRQNKSNNNDSFIIMELPKGYPAESKIRIQSYRCGKSELVTITKFHMEQTVIAAQKVASECFESQSEAGLSVCMIAISTWEECIQNQYEKNKREIAMEHLTLQTRYERELLEEGDGIEWISTEEKDLIIDRKSTFQAHVTYVNSEIMVQRALRKLIGGSSKIQRATHNMVRIVKNEIYV